MHPLKKSFKKEQKTHNLWSPKTLCFKFRATFHDETFIANACLVHSDLFTVLRRIGMIRVRKREKQYQTKESQKDRRDREREVMH